MNVENFEMPEFVKLVAEHWQLPSLEMLHVCNDSIILLSFVNKGIIHSTFRQG